MNKLYIYITILSLISCNSFLKETSQDLLIPRTVGDFSALLYGEGYPKDIYDHIDWLQLMTDDMEVTLIGGTNELNLSEQEFPYSWDENIEDERGITDNIWKEIYSYILGCNVVIDALPTIEYDNVSEVGKYNHLAGSAYTLRAYYYFCLANWYAKPYSEANLNELGVILKTNPTVTLDRPQRATLGETYDLINSDIAKALEHMKNASNTTNRYLVSKKATHFLANRIALFQENWDYVITQGEAFMKDNSQILNLNSQNKNLFGLYEDPFVILSVDNPEIIFSFAEQGSYNPYENLATFPSSEVSNFSGLTVSESLINLYEVNDLRKAAYYMKDRVAIENGEDVAIKMHNYPAKYYHDEHNKVHFFNWRNIEVLLNLAEAYARKDGGDSEKSIEWLNVLRGNRFENYIELTASSYDKEALINLVWDERRRELSYEESIRWWDMRRQGGSYEHKFYTSATDYKTYVLRENSPNFVLSIPRSETSINSVITSNVREPKKVK